MNKEMNEMVERVARAIADVHFRRKQHYGACTQDERVAWHVNKYWRNFVTDALAAIEAHNAALAESGFVIVPVATAEQIAEIDEDAEETIKWIEEKQNHIRQGARLATKRFRL
jgi:hypothetical protein